MKEMVGGCCVCSDERGWQENPLVYCDGPDCNVAVHQACYGIVSVPAGPWYCEKCLSQENVKVKCELCPMREGAVKHADTGGWAHVVCALYIPEVRFGNVTTMDPIILSGVPNERYAKTCYICEERGSKEKASEGACMQCNKLNCKSAFHVTCAQSEGLLCEESGQLDNIKYCGYCSHHFKKLKKDPSIKAVPPYKPSKGLSSGHLSSKSLNSGIIGSPLTNSTKEIANRVISTKNCRTSPAHNGGTMGINARGPGLLFENSKSNVFQNCPPSTASAPLSTTSTSTSSSSFDLLELTSKSSTIITNHNGPPSTSTPMPTPTHTSTNALAALTTLNASVGDVQSHFANVNDLRYPSGFLNTFVPTTLPSVVCQPGSSATTTTTTTTTTSIVASSSGNSSTLNMCRTKNSSADEPTPKPLDAFVDPAAGHHRKNSNKDVVASLVGHKRRATDYKKLSAAGDLDSSNVVIGKDGRIKKPRRSSSKKFESLLNLVSPVVEDTVSSFQREKVASQRLMIENNNNHPSNILTNVVIAPPLTLPPPSSSHIIEKKLPSSSSTLSADLSDANYLTSVCNLVGPSRPSLRNSAESHGGVFPTSLEQLLERQWEQGSQFLMEQAQHFDIASLLSCLHQLKIENQRLEDHIVNLIARRDHLLAVNARLSLPLGQQHTSPHSPRVNAASLPVLQQPSTSHEYSLESSASANSALSRVAAAVVSNSTMPSVQNSSSTKSFQTMGNVAVVSPPSRSASSAYALLSGGGVFNNVKHKVPSASSSSSQDLSPDRQQQQQQGPFVMPQVPTPQLAAAEHIVRSHTPLLPPQFTLTQDPHQQMLFQIMQHQAAAAYNNALSGLIQPPSPHRTAAAVAALSQSHLMQTPPSTQSKS